MSVFSGKSSTALDMIADSSVSRRRCEEIYDEMCPVVIGELRFVSQAVGPSAKGLVKSGGVWSWPGTEDFDGWVIPDGSRFSSGDFPAASAEYGSSGGSFAVPDLNGKFFKGDTDTMKSVTGKSALPVHSHPLTTSTGI